jgi:MFS family permease
MKQEGNNGAVDSDDVLTRDFVILFIASILFLGSLYLLIPVLPLYMADVAGATATQVGIFIGLLTFSSLLMRPYVGRKADQVGRKPFLVAGAVNFVIASLLYIPARSIWVLPLVLVFHGVGIACFHTASLIYIGDIAPVSQRGKSQAWFQSSFSVAIMSAAPLGIFIRDRLGYTSVFVAASIAAAASLALLVFIPEPVAGVTPDTGPAREAADRRRLLLLVSVGIFAATASLGSVEAFLGLFAEAEGIHRFALFFTISSGVLIAIRFGGGSLIDRLGRRQSVLLALTVLGASMFILASANSFAVLCISGVAWGVGFAFCSPALSALLIDNVPPEELGRAFGVYTAAFEAGIVFGATVMGPVVTAFSFRHAFVIIGCVCVAGAVFFTSMYKALSAQP